MNELLFGTNFVDSAEVGSYTYYLYTRIDNYYVIMRTNSDNTESRYYIGRGNQSTDWSNKTTLTYQKQNDFSTATKKFIVTKHNNYKSLISRNIDELL